MIAVLGVLALTLVGAENAPNPLAPPMAIPGRSERAFQAAVPAKPDAAMITFQLWVLEMDGVEWREPVYSQLQPVVRRGNTTVWTTSQLMAKTLLKRAGTKVVQAPKLTTHSEAPAHVVNRSPHQFVSEQRRNADGPVNHASYVAYSPKIEDVRDGFTATFSGRRLDQGVLTRFVLEDTRLTALHTVLLAETREPNEDGSSRGAVKTAIQVPEIAKGEVAGEWLVPNDGLLLVSLGAHTAADANGKAVVRERLVLLEARSVDQPLDSPRRAVWSRATGDRADQTAIAIPNLPSRSLPQPHDANGPIPLPPLPEEVSAPATLPGSSDPCATPQTRPGELRNSSDPNSVKAGFKPEWRQAPSRLELLIDQLGKLQLTEVPALSILPPARAIPDLSTHANAARAREARNERSKATEKVEAPRVPRASGWAPVKPTSFKLPLAGTTIEIRITPRDADCDLSHGCCEGLSPADDCLAGQESVD